MARKPRIWIPNEPYHLISRFVDREYRLLDAADREALERHITRANRRWDWRFLCYAWMSSHIHTGFISGYASPGRFFHSMNTRFAGYHNKRYGSIGPVFAGRPKQYRVKRAKCRSLVVYNHRNPVEAGVVSRASDSTWTSHRALMRLDPAPPFLDVAAVLEILGFDDTEAGRRELDEFVMDADLSDRALYVDDHDDVAEAIGTDPFERLVSDDLWRGLLGAAAAELCMARPLDDICARAALCIVVFELTAATSSEIAARVGVSPSRVRQIVGATPSLQVRAMCDRLERRLRQKAA